jgi:hypothetical protein
MGTECGRDRNGVVARRILRRADFKSEYDVLDHGACLQPALQGILAGRFGTLLRWIK